MYDAIRLFDKETFVYLLVCLLGVRAVSLRKSVGAEIWRMRIHSPGSSYGMASLAKDPVCAKSCEGFKAWSDLHTEKQTQTFSGGVKVEWRGTYNLTAKFPIMVKSFFRKKENGWFNDLQVKIAFLHHGKSFKLFLIYGKWRKKMSICISSVPTFVSSQCFSFSSKMQINLHKSLLTHSSGDLLTQLVFQLDLFFTHETFWLR